ncbi:MAG: P22 phage major capsid protein family protein [Bacteroidota bacterium]
MANTLNNLIPTLYAAMEVVSREMTGFIPAVGRDSSADRVALGKTLSIPIAGTAAAQDVTPGATAPVNGGRTDNTVDITMSKSRYVPVLFTGEETLGLQGAGTYADLVRQRMEQAFRTLGNEIDADLATEAYRGASRAYGTAGTTPFGTKDDLTDFAGVKQILEDNGAPTAECQMVLGSAAMFNLRGVQTGILQKVNEAGSADALRFGLFGDVHDFTLRNSAHVVSHTKGTGSGYQLSAAAASGATTASVDTGTGTIVAGDVVTLAGDSNKYVASGLDSGTLALNAPGLREAAADNAAVTVGNSFVGNVGFHREAIQLATRAPASPEGGDSADDRLVITDPVTGLAFEVAYYRQYRQVKIEVAIAWGYKAINSRHIALLIG